MTGSPRNYTHQPAGRPGLDPGTLGIKSRALIVQRMLRSIHRPWWRWVAIPVVRSKQRLVYAFQ
jgi:hypothetical protein